jgi:hypothetical protein
LANFALGQEAQPPQDRRHLLNNRSSRHRPHLTTVGASLGRSSSRKVASIRRRRMAILNRVRRLRVTTRNSSRANNSNNRITTLILLCRLCRPE